MTKSKLLTQYKPNLNDPRIRRKIIEVLEWCSTMRLSKREKSVHNIELTKVFGNTRQSGLAQWLRANLLIQSGHYEVGKKSMSYTLNLHGYEKLHNLIQTQLPSEVEIIQQVYSDVLTGNVKLEYKAIGDRRYHAIQSVKREFRKKAFEGWWDYDIESCAPTLVHQYASLEYRRIMHSLPIEDAYPSVTRLINDKQVVRNHFVELLEISLKQSKELLTAIFFRANLAQNKNASVYRSLGCDEVKFQKLLNDDFIVSLRREVKSMWGMARLRRFNERRLIEGRLADPTRQSQVRMKVYLSLERKVMDVIIETLNLLGVVVIEMHDGFMCKKRVDAKILEKAVLQKTGFAIRLSEIELGAVVDNEVLTDDEIDVDKIESDEDSESDDEFVGIEQESAEIQLNG